MPDHPAGMRRQGKAGVDDRSGPQNIRSAATGSRTPFASPVRGEVSSVVTDPEEEQGPTSPAEPTRSGSPTEPLATQPLAPSDEAGDDGQQREEERLRGEVATLHAQLDTRGRRRRRVMTLRRIVAALLVVIAALGVTLSVVGVWAARTTLDTDRWVETVAPLDEDPAVRAAVSTYVTDQIFDTLNVQERVEEALPPRAAFLATPLTGQVRGFVQSSVNNVLASEQFAQLWPEMNRVAHQQIMAIINDSGTVVRTSGDTVTLNLLPVVNEVLSRLEQQVPTLFGKTLNLPTITNGQIPEGLQARIESALGVTLPANFAAIPIYQGNQLSAVQETVVQSKRFLALLVVGSFLALGLALWISPRRRRTTLQFGIWLVISVVTLTSLIRAVRAQVIEQVPAGVMREGADAGVQIVFTALRDRGTQLLWLGIVIALVAYLIGPGRVPVAFRHWGVRAGQGARRYGAVAVANGPDFARAHLDALRIGGVVAAGLLLLFFSSWTGLFVIALALGLYELLVTAVAATGRGLTTAEESPPSSEAAQTSDAAQPSGSKGSAV